MQSPRGAIKVPRTASDRAVKQFVEARMQSHDNNIGGAHGTLRHLFGLHRKRQQHESYALLRRLSHKRAIGVDGRMDGRMDGRIAENPFSLVSASPLSLLTDDLFSMILAILLYEIDPPGEELVHAPRGDSAYICLLNLAQSCKWANWTVRVGGGQPMLLDAIARMLAGSTASRNLPSAGHFFDAANSLRTPAVTLLLEQHASKLRMEALAQCIDSCAMHCAEQHCARQRRLVNAAFREAHMRLGLPTREREKRRPLEEWFRHIPWKAPPQLLALCAADIGATFCVSNEEHGRVLLSVVKGPPQNRFIVQCVRHDGEGEGGGLVLERCWSLGRFTPSTSNSAGEDELVLDFSFFTILCQSVVLSQDGRFALASLSVGERSASGTEEWKASRIVVVWRTDVDNDIAAIVKKRLRAVTCVQSQGEGDRGVALQKAWFVSDGAKTVAVGIVAAMESRSPQCPSLCTWTLYSHRLDADQGVVLLTNTGAVCDDSATAPLPFLEELPRQLGTPRSTSHSHTGQTLAVICGNNWANSYQPPWTSCVRIQPGKFECSLLTYGRVQKTTSDVFPDTMYEFVTTAATVDRGGHRIALLLEDIHTDGTLGRFQTKILMFHIEDVHQFNWTTFKLQPFSSRARRVTHPDESLELLRRMLEIEKREAIYEMDFSRCGRYITLQDKRRCQKLKGIDLGLQYVDTACARVKHCRGATHGQWATPTGSSGLGWHPRHIRIGEQCVWVVLSQGVCALSFPAALR